MDNSTGIVIACLVVVPMVTAAITFVLVEAHQKDEDGEVAVPRRSMPWLAERGMGPQQEPSLPSQASLLGATAARASNGGASALLYGSRPMTALTQPPTLPLLTTPQLTPPETQASLPFLPSRASMQPVQAAPRPSPLSTALLVKNPDGVLVRLDGELLPHPEQRTVNVSSIKDANTILCAHVSELGMDDARIHVETKAKNIRIATLDTGGAIYPRNGVRPSPDRRRVVLHRVGTESDGGVGPACAYVVPAGFRKFHMVYLPESGSPAMTLYTAYGGVHIERIMDGQGNILAKSETMWQPGGQSLPPALWVREGTDMALVACAMIAVQKLAEGADEGICLNS